MLKNQTDENSCVKYSELIDETSEI